MKIHLMFFFDNVKQSVLLVILFGFFYKMNRNDSLSFVKVTYIRYYKSASASIRVSPCISLHRMSIIYIELNRDSKLTDAIGREWFHIIMKCGDSLCIVYALKFTTQQRHNRCVALLYNKRHLHHTRSHYRTLFCNPAICPSTASYN